MQLENSSGQLDSNVAASRAELNRCYDEFVKKYGNISNVKNAKAFKVCVNRLSIAPHFT